MKSKFLAITGASQEQPKNIGNNFAVNQKKSK